MNDDKYTSERASQDAVINQSIKIPGDVYVKNVRKVFDGNVALDDCSLSAHFGEIHAIMGGNGSGKSTLAKIISGVLPPDGGRISVCGEHPTSPGEARALGVATVFQEVLIADDASVVDNLFIGYDGIIFSLRPQATKIAKAEELMHELTGEHIDPLAPAGNLPLNIKQWITIGRALLYEPKILILDESSAALDFDSTERLFAKLRQLKDDGVAILLVTHRIAELMRISDRVTVLSTGRNVATLGKDELSEEKLLGLMLGGEYTVEKSPEALPLPPESSDEVLRVKNIKLTSNSEPLNFGISTGEIVGVIGLDGHGQSEFVRILAGSASAYEGYAELYTKDMRTYTPIKDRHTAYEKGIAYVSGDRKAEGILPNLSVFENMTFPLYFRRTTTHLRGIYIINWTRLKELFNWEANRLSINTGGSIHNLIIHLSGGNQQKVLIGRAFIIEPKILILHDPTRGVDINTKKELYRILRDFCNEGGSVIFMSSELEEFLGLTSRVYVFRYMNLFTTLTGADINEKTITEAMFGRLTPASSTRFDKSTNAVHTDSNESIESTDRSDNHDIALSAVPISGNDVAKQEGNVRFNVSRFTRSSPSHITSEYNPKYTDNDEENFHRLLNPSDKPTKSLDQRNSLKTGGDIHTVYTDEDQRAFDKIIQPAEGNRSSSITKPKFEERQNYDSGYYSGRDLELFNTLLSVKNNKVG